LVRELNDACPGLGLVDEDVVRSQWGWLPLKNGKELGRAGALADRPRITDHGARGVRRLISVEGVKFTTARRVVEQAIDRVFSSLGQVSPRCQTAERLLEGGAMVLPESAKKLGEEEILRAVRQEMAIKLSDLVFRRTALGAALQLDRGAVEAAAGTFGKESGWNASRIAEEVEVVMSEAGAAGAALETVA
jgi:glycerol-3-phosphate dehydrogenase